PHIMFPLPADTRLECNRLTLRIQPDEGIHLSFQTKVPDHGGMELAPADLDFSYARRYAGMAIPGAYERLLLDAMHGDATLFMRSDEIEKAWQIIEPFLKATERAGGPEPEVYPVGSLTPACAEKWLARENREWAAMTGCE